MKVGFVTLDWSQITGPDGTPSPGGAGWYRTALPAEALKRYSNGEVETVIGPDCGYKEGGGLAVRTWRNEVHNDCDVIVLQRWMEETAVEATLKARAAGQIVVNDVDDWYDGLDPQNRAFWYTHPKFSPEANRNIYRKAVASSSAITVTTPFLHDKLKRLGRPVYLLPNAIDLERWDVQDVTGQAKIGWVGSTGFRSRDLQELRGVLGPFLNRHDLEFVHAGAAPGLGAAGLELGVDENRTSTVSMCSIYDYPKLFEGFNVGLAPLSDVPFNHAKSAIKGLEYAASGIPFVASRAPAYMDLAHRYGVGLIAHRPKHWIRHLEHLLDEQERIELGRHARKAIAPFDIRTAWQNWAKVYTEILHTPA